MRFKLFALAASLTLAAAALPSHAQYDRGPQGPPPPPPQQGGNWQRGHEWQYEGGAPGTYRPDWDRMPAPRRGACFFTDANFSGHRFCVRSGDRLPFLPEGYGHSISSVQTFGGARVIAYARRDFQGETAQFRNAPDLGFTSRGPYRGWNDRISSVVVQ